jgi:exo-1,4-beta-D-glucosaminidase
MVVVRNRLALLVVATSAVLAAPARAQSQDSTIPLTAGWNLQSSAQVHETGEALSSPSFQPKDWHPATVPTTVVAALVTNKTYPDPFFGMNLRSIPGTTYKVATNFANSAMPKDSPFAVPWWYRTQFKIPAAFAGKTLWLALEGINYRANVWLNGKRIANASDIAGAWRSYELNITEAARTGAINALAVEVFAQTENDLGVNFVDWNPLPPDKNLGLLRGVSISATGPVAVRHPAVITHLDAPDRAQLTVTALLKNGTGQAVKGTLKGRIGKVAFAQEITLAAGERKDATFTPDKYPQLAIAHPRLWWPAQMGTPALSELDLEFEVQGKPSDRRHTTFGIREIKSELDAQKSRVFLINGKRILIRGGGWAKDMMMREDPARVEDELRYVLDMGLNTVRLEAQLESEHFFDFADRHGILVMAGWCCCDFWEAWPKWKPADLFIAAESTRDQLYRLRAHPSLLAWLNASDGPPPRDVENRYLQVAAETRWPNPVLSSASNKPSEAGNISGVKMLGPYDWVAPKYWLEDSQNGGAFGFNSETGPGPAIPPIESLRRMLPEDKLWPINEHWNFHAGGQQFKQMDLFINALEARYGKATSAEDLALKSQLMTYEGTRAMFEAFSRNKYRATGVIHWMLNNAWPGLIWHLYDYYLRPGGGYFGAKKATETLHPIYSYDDGSVWVVSSQYKDETGLALRAKVYNLDMTEKFSREAKLDLPADGSRNVFTLPVIEGLTPTHFVVLTLNDGKGKLVGSNFYWLSSKRETVAYDQAQWYTTATRSFADFTALSQLAKVKLDVSSRTERKGDQSTTHVTVSNPGRGLAFFVRLKLNRGAAGEEVLPVMWQDNYFSLLPGERREITAQYRTRDLGGTRPGIAVSGANVQ